MKDDRITDLAKVLAPEEMHSELQKYRSSICFITDELAFIEKLLHSYVFEPDTPNLFERLQKYIASLEKLKQQKKTINKYLCGYECKIGGAIEGKGFQSDPELYKDYNTMKSKISDFIDRHQKLKAEIFNYAGGILKKHRPDT
ncbi:MAG: hypothetical protein WBN11_15470 [Eudoraea sp.]|uniref:hypothetical protein n=1 Tax=Eudoraea sp. TaxID=1979955 RepID=UPI003C71DE49